MLPPQGSSSVVSVEVGERGTMSATRQGTGSLHKQPTFMKQRIWGPITCSTVHNFSLPSTTAEFRCNLRRASENLSSGPLTDFHIRSRNESLLSIILLCRDFFKSCRQIKRFQSVIMSNIYIYQIIFKYKYTKCF